MRNPFRKSKPSDDSEQKASFANRLLYLEVNIVLKDAMAALPVKDEPRQVLMDIARNYRRGLKGFGINIEDEYCCFDIPGDPYDRTQIKLEDSILETNICDIGDKCLNRIFISLAKAAQFGLTQKTELKLIPTGSYASFNRIREIADDKIDEILAEYERTENEDTKKELNKNIVMLTRIRDMSDHIKEIFKEVEKRHPEASKRDVFNEYGRFEINNAPSLNLFGTETNTIRKIWDLGNEEVLMQSIISLDGDVTTRVSPSVLGEQYRYLYEIHNRTVQTSIDYWKDLIDTVKDFIEFFISTGISLIKR